MMSLCPRTRTGCWTGLRRSRQQWRSCDRCVPAPCSRTLLWSFVHLSRCVASRDREDLFLEVEGRLVVGAATGKTAVNPAGHRLIADDSRAPCSGCEEVQALEEDLFRP